MRRVDRKVNGHTYVLETFENFDELIRVCDSREVKPEAIYDATRKKTDDALFMGTGTYDEAVKLLKYGEQKDIKKIKQAISSLEKTQNVYKTSFKNDVVGFAPIVPNAILGLPNSMIGSTKRAKPFKVITIIADMAVKVGIKKSEVFEYGVKLVQKIVQLENNGYRVRLEYLKCFNKNKHHVAMSTVIKNENQPLDIKRVTFPLTNVAMQRYISWDWFDRVPNAYYDSGRGRSLSTYDNEYGKYSREKRNEICRTLVNDAKNKYVICYGDDLEEVFKGIK